MGGVGDSPSSNEADGDESYFNEFRSFFGKVTTYTDGPYTPTSVGCLQDVETDMDGSDADTDICIDKEPLSSSETIEVAT